MREVRTQLFQCTIMSVAGTDDPASEHAALNIVKYFGTRCRVVVVTSEELTGAARATFGRVLNIRTGHWEEIAATGPTGDPTMVAARQTSKLAALSRSAGLETDIVVRQITKALAELRSGKTGDLLIVALPSDPLARQAQPFAALHHAALFAPAAVVFVPPSRAATSSGILVLARDEHDPALKLAERIRELTGEAVERSPMPGLDALALPRSPGRPVPPSLVIMTRSELVRDPSAVSRTAIRLGVPILVLEPDSLPEPDGRRRQP